MVFATKSFTAEADLQANICLKIGLGRETFSCENHKSVRLILWQKYQCKKKHWKEKKRLCMRLLELRNTTWENLQIAKHKSVGRWFSWADWFVLCDLQIFSGSVYHLERPLAQSLFLFPIVFCNCRQCYLTVSACIKILFCINLIHFSMGRTF